MNHNESLIQELMFLQYLIKDFDGFEYSEQDFLSLHDRKKQFKSLSTEELETLRTEIIYLLDCYNAKFQGKLDIVSKNWLKIDWG